MSKVKKITVANLKAISQLTADFNGCTAIVTGGNNKGKSSFLKSLPERLKSIKPETILKEGESEGYAEWELTTGEKLIWEFNNTTKKGEKLIFITKDNIKTSLTQEIASRFFPKGFDIDRFLNDSAKGQRDALQKIVGIDFADIDKRYQEAYDTRTYANRVAKDSEVKLLPIDALLPVEVEPIDKLNDELSAIESHNSKVDYVIKGVSEKEERIVEYDEEVKRLEAQIIEINNKASVLSEEVNAGKEWLGKEENKHKTDEFKQKLVDKIDAIKEANKEIEQNNKAILLKEEHKRLQESAKEADDVVKSIDKEKIDLVRSAKLPEGFDFTDTGITYNGLAFTKEQLSSSAIYIAALKLASLNIGEVKTLHFDASYLDKKSLDEIEKWANENDLQLLIERPDFEGGEIEYHLLGEYK